MLLVPTFILSNIQTFTVFPERNTTLKGLIFENLQNAAKGVSQSVTPTKEWQLFQHSILWSAGEILYDPWLTDIHSANRNATSKLAGRIHVCDFSATTCSQMSYECMRTMRNFRMGFLANCYMGYFRNDIWPNVHWPCTVFCKRKATAEKLCFFWVKMYTT